MNIKKQCNFYDKQVGCYNTFDGKCNKENCQTYNLIKENEKLKEEIKKLSDPRYQIMKVNEGYYNRMKKYKQALEEIKEKLKKYDANIGDTIIANPIQDCYYTYKLINKVLK